jgi:hypothetical protein
MLLAAFQAVLLAGLAQSPQELDTITLNDGQVMLGRIEQEDDNVVLFREIRLGGRITALHQLPRSRVQTIQRGQPVGSAGEPAAAPHPATLQDKIAAIRAIVEEYRVHNLTAAASRLADLLAHATPQEQAALERVTRETLDWSLPRFAAEVQLGCSLQRCSSGYFRLYYVTPQAVPELHALLMQAQQSALLENICCGDPDHKGDCKRVDWIAHWIDRPGDYDGSGACASAFARQITRVMGMNRELIRLGPAAGQAERAPALQLQTQHLRTLLQAVQRRT